MIRSGFMFAVLAISAIFVALSATAAETKSEKLAPAPVGEAKQAPIADSKAPVPKSAPLPLNAEALKEIQNRFDALEKREAALNEREKNIEIQDKILREKLKKIEELSGKVAERLDGFKAQFEQKVQKLVSVVEGMKPQSAAEYLENLEPNLAVEILSRVQVVKASKVLNLMNKAKGARLSELYTGFMDRKRASASNEDSMEQNSSKEVPATDSKKL